MATGIFGGTFDPIHVGHLRAAEEVREAFSLNTIHFVPGCIPPHKRDLRISGADMRLAMLRKAIRGNRFLRVSEIEIKRGGISYSIDTVKTFGRRFKELYFLVGIDAFSEIDTWHNYSEIFCHTHLIVMVRPTQDRPEAVITFPAGVKESVRRVDKSIFEHDSGKRIYIHHVTQLDISSTRIRESVREGKSIKYLVSHPVERFINERRLYVT